MASIIKAPRRPLTPHDVIKRIPHSPSDINISVSIPTPALTGKGHVKQKKIVLTPKAAAEPARDA